MAASQAFAAARNSPEQQPAGDQQQQGHAVPASSNEPRSEGHGQVDWADLVRRIQADDPAAMEELYGVFSGGIRFYLCRRVGAQDLEDKVHDVFLIVVQAIKRGELREPEKLLGFIRTVVRRQIAAHIDEAVHSRRELTDLESTGPLADTRIDPETLAIERQKVEIMKKVLRSISPRDREILIRFYLLEQSQQQICREMNLTQTQFRLLKSRAKARFGELGRKKFLRPMLRRFFVRRNPS